MAPMIPKTVALFGAALWFGGLAIETSYGRTHPTEPNVATGETIPLFKHGNGRVYVTASENELIEGLEIGGMVCLLVAAVFYKLE